MEWLNGFRSERVVLPTLEIYLSRTARGLFVSHGGSAKDADEESIAFSLTKTTTTNKHAFQQKHRTGSCFRPPCRSLELACGKFRVDFRFVGACIPIENISTNACFVPYFLIYHFRAVL